MIENTLRIIEKKMLNDWLDHAIEVKPPFSFQYEGGSFPIPGGLWHKKTTITDTPVISLYNVLYTAPDGLDILMEMKKYKDCCAVEWVLHISNHSTVESKIFSDVLSCDTVLPYKPETEKTTGVISGKGSVLIFTAKGSEAGIDDFMPYYLEMPPNVPVEFKPLGGRSSSEAMPYFNIVKQDMGVICAIGWSGQWKATFTRVAEGIHMASGLEKTYFKLLPGETIRTPSMLMLFWEGGQARGHNIFRKWMLEHVAPQGVYSKAGMLPLSNISWGGMETQKHIERIRILSEYDLPYEMYWIDAGWYGAPESHSPSPFDTGWWEQVGNWEVNSTAHPNGLEPIAKAAENVNMQFLLWFEPERAYMGIQNHIKSKDWYLEDAQKLYVYNVERVKVTDNQYMVVQDGTKEKYNKALLLNLGKEEPLEWIIGLISKKIKSLGINCLRQDFNINPLAYWLQADDVERQGITETKYITGLYKFWDTLLERFPGLLIDNCASGGRRLDFEAMRRTISLWRSDYQCYWNCDPSGAQAHNNGLAWWIPWTATAPSAIFGDTYNVRSCYSAGMGMCFLGYDHSLIDQNHLWDWHKKILLEFKRARPYFLGDFYPLTGCNVNNEMWMAWQFDRPDLQGGLVQVFRRQDSPFESGRFMLGGIDINYNYEFENVDTNEIIVYSSDELKTNGFTVRISYKYESKLFFYKMIK